MQTILRHGSSIKSRIEGMTLAGMMQYCTETKMESPRIEINMESPCSVIKMDWPYSEQDMSSVPRTIDMKFVDKDGPLYFNMMHDKPLDVHLIPVIGEAFIYRRLGSLKWLSALHTWTMMNLAGIPMCAIYPKKFLPSCMNPKSSVPNPAIMGVSIKTHMLAIRIMDKFFAAGASVSSRQRCLNFNVWKEEAFSALENDALIIYTAVCYVIACKMEMSEAAPRMVEVYDLIKHWERAEVAMNGSESSSEWTSKTPVADDDSDGRRRVVLEKLYAAEVLVLQECDWSVGMITAMHVIEEVSKEKCDDPNFLQFRSLAIENAMCTMMDAKYVYAKGCSATGIALSAMSDTQLEIDAFSTPPTQRRGKRSHKKMRLSLCKETEDEALLERWKDLDPSLRSLVDAFLQGRGASS